MQSQIVFGFLRNGVSVSGNRVICPLDVHPGITDAVGLDTLVSIMESTYFAATGQFNTAEKEIGPVAKEALSGKQVIGKSTAHETFPQGGALILDGTVKVVDELRVVYHAWSASSTTPGQRTT
jgi:hypothetical protein